MSAAVADQPADQASESGMANYYASKIGDLSVVSAARGLGREGGREGGARPGWMPSGSGLGRWRRIIGGGICHGAAARRRWAASSPFCRRACGARAGVGSG